MSRVIVVIQARMGSQRLPGKIVWDVYGKCLLERVVRQARRIRRADTVIVATSSEPQDDITELICARLTVDCYRGSSQDVRSRFIEVARQYAAEILVRLTSDNPLTEPRFADALIEYLLAHPEVDYCEMEKRSIALGTGSEVFRTAALELDAAGNSGAYAREHVTPGIRQGPRSAQVEAPPALAIGGAALTVDTFEDYVKLNRIYARYGDAPDLLERLTADCRAGRVPVP